MISNSNKYGSIIETFVTNASLNALLSTLAVPPADLALNNASFTTSFIYARGGVGTAPSRYGKFIPQDIPRLIGYGIFCNLADGLVWSDNLDNEGLAVGLTWSSYDVANALLQADFTGSGTVGPNQPVFYSRVNALNTIHDCDFRWNFSAINTACNHFRGIGRIEAPSGVNFSTITIDPTFQTKQIIFWPVFVFEHSATLIGDPF